MKRTPKKRKYTDEYVKVLGKNLIKWLENPSNFWLGTFAVENKISRPRLQELACTNDEFSKIYEMAKQMQENKLVLLGMARKIDTTMAIFALKNVAGWRDKNEHLHSVNVTLETIVKNVNSERIKNNGELARVSDN